MLVSKAKDDDSACEEEEKGNATRDRDEVRCVLLSGQRDDITDGERRERVDDPGAACVGPQAGRLRDLHCRGEGDRSVLLRRPPAVRGGVIGAVEWRRGCRARPQRRAERRACGWWTTWWLGRRWKKRQ